MTALDTNVLLRYANTTDPNYPVVSRAVQTLTVSGDTLCLFPQNVYEFWATATRPLSANGFGWTPAATLQACSALTMTFVFLDDKPGLFTEWERLVTQHQCHGRVSFDARIVAAMNTHGVTRLLTFNVPDFARYPGLTVLDPAGV